MKPFGTHVLRGSTDR